MQGYVAVVLAACDRSYFPQPQQQQQQEGAEEEAEESKVPAPTRLAAFLMARTSRHAPAHALQRGRKRVVRRALPAGLVSEATAAALHGGGKGK